MKKLIIILLLLPLSMMAQVGSKEADALLDKAVDVIKNDAALQMDYYYKVIDDDDTVVQQDKGVMKLDGERYALLMEKMKVWCNGKVQWSYMSDIDEIYITDARSDEAQSLSPLVVMEKYRAGYTSSLEYRGDIAVVTMLSAEEEAEINKVELFISKDNYRLSAMFVYMAGQGCIEVRMTNYTAKCRFSGKEYECPVKELVTAEIVDMR